MRTVDTTLESRPEWLGFLGENEYAALVEILRKSHEAGIPILLGGGLGLSAYMPLRRWTKDLDFYIHPSDKDRMIRLLTESGFGDFYEKSPYDRGWIYRSIRDDVIVDIIWSFANYLTQVDEEWFEHARSFPVAGMTLKVIPPEELLWAKLFVFQRERCDWPDLLNLIHYTKDTLNWRRLESRLGENLPLLEALQKIAGWVNPHEGEGNDRRVRLLDSRPWYLPYELRHEIREKE